MLGYHLFLAQGLDLSYRDPLTGGIAMLIRFQDVLDLGAKYGHKLTSVAHAGGHYAEELEDYLAAGFDPIVFFEPLAANCDVIGEKLKQLDVRDRLKVQVFQAAVGNPDPTLVDRWVPIHISSNEAQSSSLLKPSHHTVQYPHITFPDVTWVTLVAMDEAKLTPDLLAMDTQGYELEVLKGATETLKSVKVVYTEVSNVPLYEGSALVEDLDTFLQPFGFKRVRTEWAGGTWGDAVYVRIA